MLDFEQQANQAQALASLDEDWHLLEDPRLRLDNGILLRRSRPTMISAKYRAREERRRLMKISVGKMRRIEYPETCLCRSVLINNAVTWLQRKNRDEKTRNSVGVTDDNTTSRKRLSEDARTDGLGSKRQRHDDPDLQDDVFSDFYILPPTPRLLSHIDEVQEPKSPHHHHLVYPEGRLGTVNVRSSPTTMISTSTANTTTSNCIANNASNANNTANNNSTTTTSSCCSSSVMSPSDLDDCGVQLNSVVADSGKSLEERLVELQSLDEHFDLAKFERKNNQSCGRAFHDIQTFHSLVPGLET